ncbi:MAG: chemotaxis protein CheA [Thermoflexales bacterium]|nr:chemotaxis protein CheA [Thermoflexales bacterium]
MDDSPVFALEADEVDIFLQDVNEHLQAMESGILGLEAAGGLTADLDTLNAVFRAAHTLKAIAGAVGHQPMAELTHAIESLFDRMREDSFSPTQELTDVLLNAVDALKALRDEIAHQQPSRLEVAPILDQLRALSSVSQPTSSPLTRLSDISISSPPSLSDVSISPGQTLLEINVKAEAGSFSPAARLLQAAMAMADLGQVLAQRPGEEELLEDRHEGCLWLVLATGAGAQAVEEALANVSELAEFQVHPYTAAPRERAMASRQPIARQRPQIKAEREAHPAEQTVRIGVERLDVLMNLVGELVTDRTRLVQTEETLRAHYGKEEVIGTLNNTISHVSQIIDQLQDEVMRARLLPIAHLFDKFPRLVRDTARASGKQVKLVIEGEDTELDRSVIEAIGDPLIHLLRNAVDHGIERPEVRAAAGKPSAGLLRLVAGHAEGQIVITVTDDGGGVDTASARQAAVKRGMISEEEAARLSDDEAIMLIFQPGLSTAEQVGGVSGRGVGLDVVRTNINRVGGSVVVDSRVGYGTSFRVTLPLTLAIVPTMLVGLGDDTYAIPMTSIIESLYLSDANLHGVRGRPAIRWRGQVLPLLNLREFFYTPPSPLRGASEAAAGGAAKKAVVAVAWGKLQVGLIVDRIIGKQEIVIKPLGPVIGNTPGLAGCTIMGSGRIALIVDVPGLVNMASRTQKWEGGR